MYNLFKKYLYTSIYCLFVLLITKLEINLTKIYFILKVLSKHSISKVNYSTYVVGLNNKLYGKFSSIYQLDKLYLNETNVYFFWTFFSHDYVVNTFINLITKEGKKYLSYKNMYNCLFYIKQLTGLQPLLVIKKLLSRNRFLFDMKYIKLRYRLLTIPTLLSTKKQISKSINYIFNNFFFKKSKLFKKRLPFFKKMCFVLLSMLFNSTSFEKLIKKDMFFIMKNFHHISKEEFFTKYVKNVNRVKKTITFKTKRKSLSSKIKFLQMKKRFKKQWKKVLNKKKKFLLTRYNLNTVSRIKLKSKWFY